MQPSKRRKVDHASSILTKPFRSPTKKNVDAISLDGDVELSSTLRSTTATTNTSVGVPAEQMRSEDLHETSSKPDVLQKEYTLLSRQLTALRQSLDTAQQALHIESTDQKGKINALIHKWRNVTRDCAEEVFDGSKDRVAMGVGTDKRPRREALWQDDDETLLSKEQGEFLDQQKQEEEELARKYNLIEPTETEEDSEKVSFIDKGEDPLIHYHRNSPWPLCCNR